MVVVLAKGSGPFVAASLGLLAIFICLALAWSNLLTYALAALAALLCVFVAFFFRDPDRVVGEGVVAPADGRVMAVEASGGKLHIAIFMSPLDVHVNRAPADCKVAEMKRAGEGFRLAYEPSSNANVRLEWSLETSDGTIAMHQITGWFARRIVPYAEVGRALVKGERMGMIRFGSRVDIWLPVGAFEPVVSAGESVKAGSSTVARRGGSSK